MANIAAALAACTLFLWTLSIVLMGTVYQQTGVALAGLGLITAATHAYVQLRPVWIHASTRAVSSTDQLIISRRRDAMTEQAAPTVVHHHPLEGHESAFTAWIGFFSTLLLSVALFSILTGNWIPPTLTITAAVAIGPEIYIPVTAMAFYRYQESVSLKRPDNMFYAWLDLFGSAMVFVVAFIGVASWFPAMSWMLERVHAPVAPFNTLTVVAAFTYLVLSSWDVFWNHWRRSRLSGFGPAGAGHEMVQDILQGKDAMGPFTVHPEVVVEPVYKLRQPNGVLRVLNVTDARALPGPAESH